MRILKPLPGTLPMPEKNVAADWLFNSLGDQVFDLSGFGNIGNIFCGLGAPLWDSGRLGHGLRFDGIDDHVFTAGNIDFTGANSFSVIVLFSTVYALTDNYLAGTGLHIGWYLRVGSAAPNGYVIVKVDDGIDDAWVLSATGGYNDGNLHQLVLVWDAPNNQIEGFIDGNSFGTDFQLNVNDMQDIVWLGGDPTIPRYYRGLIEQATIFNYALAVSEVAGFYREAFCRYPENRCFAVA